MCSRCSGPLAAAADLPVLSPEEIACQKATFTSATSYIQRAFAARQDCLLEAMKGNLAPTVDCFARLDDGGTGDVATDTSLDAAARAVAVDITNPCIGLDFTNLGFPGFCPIVVEGEYTLLDHEVCILTASDDVIETLLGIEYPWPIDLPVANAPRSCGDTIGRKSSQMFVNETDTRTLCQTHQLEGTVALAVDCRAEDERLDPATGDTAVDTDILTAHNKVLRETANACTHTDLTDLGFPGECGTPIGSTFTRGRPRRVHVRHAPRRDDPLHRHALAVDHRSAATTRSTSPKNATMATTSGRSASTASPTATRSRSAVTSTATTASPRPTRCSSCKRPSGSRPART